MGITVAAVLGIMRRCHSSRTTTPLRRVSEISSSAFRDDFFLAAQPVIVTGGARGLPAFERWSNEYLIDALPNVRPTVRLADGRLAHMNLATFLDYLDDPDSYSSATGPVYLADFYLRPGWPSLAGEAPCPFPLPGIERRETDRESGFAEFLMLYAGPRGTKTSMHQDVYETHTWLAELRGTKAWRICAPDDLDPNTAWDIDAFANPDQVTAARGGGVPPLYEAVLEPGDCIYLPPDWWHQVHNESSTLAVTGNFCTFPHARASLAKAKEAGDARVKMWSALLSTSQRSPSSTSTNTASVAAASSW